MGELTEFYDDVKTYQNVRNSVRNDFYTKIMEELGGRYLTSCTYRLGDYNIYTSKGYVKHKSNKGDSIPLQQFLKEHYNYEVDGKALNQQMVDALK